MMMAASAGWPMVQLHRLTLAIILTLSVPASPFFLPVRGISPSWARSGAFSRNLRGTNARTLGVRGAAMLASEEDFQSEAVRSEPAVYLLKWELLQDTFQARAEAAFRAARAQWPSEMAEVAELTPRDAGVRKAWVGGDWSKYAEDEEGRASDDMPRWLLEKLRMISPVVATSGGSLVLAVRLCVSEASAAKRSKSGQRPLTVGEITENWEEVREVLLAKFGARLDALDARFAAEFEALAAGASGGGAPFVAANPLYRGIDQALAPLLAPEAPSALYVVTDAPAALAADALGAAGVAVGAGQVLRAQSGEAREGGETPGGMLARVRAAMQAHPGRRVHVIDDSPEVLRRVSSDLALAGAVHCWFAEWGYSTPAQRAAVAFWPRVKLLDIFALRRLLAGRAP